MKQAMSPLPLILAVIFVAAIVVWLVIGAVLEERVYLHNRVLAVLAKSGLMFIARRCRSRPLDLAAR